MNLHQLYLKQVEAWKESYAAKILNDYGSVFLKDALSSRHKDTIELLEAEIERKKGMRVPQGKEEEFTFAVGYNSAIEDDIAYLEGELRKLKNEQ